MIKRNKNFILLIIIIFLLSMSSNFNIKLVYADALSDNINEQLNKLDFSQLENFFNSIIGNSGNNDFFIYINKLLKGEYTTDYASITNYIINTLLNGVLDKLPVFISIIAIAILCGIIKDVKSEYLSESISEITFFVCMLGIILLLATEIFLLYKNIENIIKNIAKLCEIMSPIIITLMLAIGGNVSASVYKPAVAFLSNGVINVALYTIMPLVGISFVINVASNFSTSIRLTKFNDFISGVIKWIFGLTVTIFGAFLSVQGITSAHFDGISIKATKYAISNSIPIVGGFIKDGFDLVVAGSVLIKNSVGITVIFLLMYMLVSPALHLAVFSLLLKITAAIVEPISDVRISNFCTSTAKIISYLTAILFMVGLMFFITILLMTFSANAFI